MADSPGLVETAVQILREQGAAVLILLAFFGLILALAWNDPTWAKQHIDALLSLPSSTWLFMVLVGYILWLQKELNQARRESLEENGRNQRVLERVAQAVRSLAQSSGKDITVMREPNRSGSNKC